MEPTIMPSISLLVTSLSSDFPQLRFIPGETFQWSPKDATVYYPLTADDRAALLHELAHALLAHVTYSKDISLLAMERDAWQYAQGQLGPRYNVIIPDDEIETALDTYRDWLHARSTCPRCHAIGLQTKKHLYKCLVCHSQWRVNDARVCALRRYLQ